MHTGESYDNYVYSPEIPVSKGDVFRGVTFRFVTALVDGVADSNLGGNSVSTYTVPATVTSVILSVSPNVTITRDRNITTYKRKTDVYRLENGWISKTGTFTSGGLYNYILLANHKFSLAKGLRVVFSCDCVSGSSFEIGNTASGATPTNSRNNVIGFNSTSITYGGTSYTHGLTIEGIIKVIIEQLPDAKARVTLMANGNSFTQEIPYVMIGTQNLYVLADDLVANNCKLSFTCADFAKKIWIFGNSYWSYASDRTRYYLHSYGYDENALINAHSGAGSGNAYTALSTLIKYGRPEIIVWCMGMNDGSDTDANNPSSTWITYRDQFLTLCEAYDITPVFITVPNVPTVSHVGKNAWVKASGYRYIDFCHAVGADSVTSWLGNMLSNDGVHPSATGAKALFAQMVLDFPEIMIG